MEEEQEENPSNSSNHALEPYIFQDLKIDEMHNIAYKRFQEYWESDFKNVEKEKVFRYAYEQAIKRAQGDDLMFLKRRYASSLWRISPRTNRNLRLAQRHLAQIKEHLNDKNSELLTKNSFLRSFYLDQMRIAMLLLKGEIALDACENLVKLNINDQLKKAVYRSLFTLNFSRYEFVHAQQALDDVKKIIGHTTSTELRHEAKLIIMEKLLNSDG